MKRSKKKYVPDEVFNSLGHPSRVRIVKELSAGSKCVCELVTAVGSTWPTVSRHLSVLREAGVVEDEKVGMQVFYRLKLPCVTRFIECLEHPSKMPVWVSEGCLCA